MNKTKDISLSTQEKLAFLSNITTLITAGIPLLSSLDSLLDDSQGNVQKMLEVIRTDVLQGKPLYTSFAKFPRVFDKVSVNMLKASEEAGTMDAALKDMREQMKKDIEFNSRLRSAMIYPVLVLGVFLGILLMILIVVIPKIALVFSQLNVALPLPTKILIFSSNILLHQTIFVLLGVFGIVALFLFLFRYKKESMAELFYHFPIISKLVREIDCMRFSQSMHLLLSSGITIGNALDLSAHVVVTKDIARGVEKAKEAVLGGRTMSSAMRSKKNVFPKIMVQLVEAGEKTGTLDHSLRDVALYFDYQVTDTLKTLTVALEPILLVLVGLVVGSMMLAIIAPIYSLIGQITPH